MRTSIGEHRPAKSCPGVSRGLTSYATTLRATAKARKDNTPRNLFWGGRHGFQRQSTLRASGLYNPANAVPRQSHSPSRERPDRDAELEIFKRCNKSICHGRNTPKRVRGGADPVQSLLYAHVITVQEPVNRPTFSPINCDCLVGCDTWISRGVQYILEVLPSSLGVSFKQIPHHRR